MTPHAWDAVLNVHAEDDHIIPSLTSPALDGKVDTKDHTELGPAGGYSGVFAYGKSPRSGGKGIVDGLSRRDS